MIEFWIQIPLALRLALLGCIGVIGGALANHVIYSWCWFPRPISPWATPAEKSPPRQQLDRLPILGWFFLRRETPLHGRGFWIRPLLIELGLAIALPALYWYETQFGGLLPAPFRVPMMLGTYEAWHTRIFFGHAVLVLLMVAATFIDFDEQTIPDSITLPGTLFALLISTFSAWGFMPVAMPVGGATRDFVPALFSLPWWPPGVAWSTNTGLLTGLAIWSGWCFALADRRVILRRGFLKAIEFFCAGLVRHRTWKLLLAIWFVGTIFIVVVFLFGGIPWLGLSWLGLFSSLVGLAVGGGVIWAIRIIASAAMGMEAMGFGDVTLMAMIGAFLGWQAAFVAFFLSPFAAIVIVIVQFIVTRQPRVPFGPYLCAGALLSILGWDAVMNRWLLPNLNDLGPFVLWLCLSMLGLMGVMLFLWRQIKQALFGR